MVFLKERNDGSFYTSIKFNPLEYKVRKNLLETDPVPAETCNYCTFRKPYDTHITYLFK